MMTILSKLFSLSYKGGYSLEEQILSFLRTTLFRRDLRCRSANRSQKLPPFYKDYGKSIKHTLTSVSCPLDYNFFVEKQRQGQELGDDMAYSLIRGMHTLSRATTLSKFARYSYQDITKVRKERSFCTLAVPILKQRRLKQRRL